MTMPYIPPRRRPTDDEMRPLTRVRPEPADATRSRALQDLMRLQDQARQAGRSSMQAPSGLVEEPLWARTARFGADVLPPISIPEMVDAGKKAWKGDYAGAAGQAGAEIMLAGMTGGMGRKAAAAKKLMSLEELSLKAAEKAKFAATRKAEAGAARELASVDPFVGPLEVGPATAKIPAAGIFRKPEDGAKKSDAMPSPRVVNERLARADAALRLLERDAVDWTPNPRGILDRTGFDPNYRMRPNTNTLFDAAGRDDEVLGESLSNKRLLNLMERQTALGLRLGGEGFYNLKPLADAYKEIGGPLSFEDWVGASSAGSIQSPLPQEMANASIMLYALGNGISHPEAIAELAKRYPKAQKPWTNSGQWAKFQDYLREGRIDPDSPASGSRKVPYYSRQKLGESMSPEELRRASSPMGAVVDTHESKNVLYPVGLERLIDGLTGRQYEQVSDVYRVLAQRLGIPVETVQAGRWLGGGPLTGLKSPQGDYIQGFEDAVYKSAMKTGKDMSPAGLRRYRDDVLQGRDFLMPDYGGGK